MSRNRKISLYEQVEKKILDEATHTDIYRLKPEDELALDYGVSRTTIREALNSLQRDKYLMKRKGKGNYLLKSVINTQLRFDMRFDFASMIDELNKVPSVVTNLLGSFPPSDKFKQYCPDFANTESVQRITWTFYADELPAVHCYFELPQSLCISMPMNNTIIGKQKILAINSYYDIARQDITHYIHTLCAKINDEVTAKFSLPQGTPLVNFEQISYNADDIPFSFTDIYFNPEIMNLKYVLDYDRTYRRI
ncbi:MAG: GntR family transcriptional regulator [Clostridia bacterium]